MSKMEQRFDGRVLKAGPDPEVMPMPKRRRYSREYKLHILAKAEQCHHIRLHNGINADASTTPHARYRVS
jgi:hypothetical protein